MSKNYIKVNSLSVSERLLNFVNKEAIEGTNLNKKKFWDDFEKAIYKLIPINKSLLQKRRILQLEIDRWHLNNRGKNFNKIHYENFLKKIGYLEKEGKDFKIKTKNLDYEISKVPGPQLVVPINNARYDPLENVKIRLIRDIKSKDALSLSSSKKVFILPELINL